MANHWLNWSSEIDNVVVSDNSSLCIGSHDTAELFAVDQKLSNNIPVGVAIESEALTIILFKSITELRYICNASSVSIRYRNKKKEENITIELGSQDKAEELFDHVSQYVAKNLTKRIGDNARYLGLVFAVNAVFFSAASIYAFFNIHRLVAYSIPLLCVAGTIAYAIHLNNKQRSITRWTSDSHASSIRTPTVRAIGACIIFSTFALCTSLLFDENYGQKALYSSAQRGSLKASEISGYLTRGSRIHYIDTEGKNVLWWSIKNLDESVTLRLMAQGADIRANDGHLLEHALKNQASETLLKQMLKAGVLEVAELNGNFDTKYYLESNDKPFANAFNWHRTTY